jgi:O-antigen/teichoic acid export membrane protein
MLRPLIFKTLVTNVGIAALALVNSILLSRWLGPAGRGEVAAAMLWATLMVYISSLGVISSCLYFSALPDSRPEAIFANGLTLAAVQSLVTLPLAFFALPWLLHNQTSAVVIAGQLYLLIIPIGLITQYGTSILQGRMQISAFNQLRLIIPLGYLTGTTILWAAGRLTLLHIIIMHIALQLIGLIGVLFALLRAGIHLSFRADFVLGKQMLKYGIKAHVGNLSGMANVSLDQVLMAAWLPPVYLGLYVVAVNSATVSQVFSQAVQMVLTPGTAQKKLASERALVLQGVFRRYWLLSLFISLLLAALLPFAIPLIFGLSFKDAVWPAVVLLFGVFLLGAKEVLAGGAQALGNPWLGSKAQLWAVGVTIILLSILLPSMGIMGAAIASAAAYGTQLLIVVFGLYRSHAISPANLFRVKLADLVSAFDVLELIRGRHARLLSGKS